MKNLSFLLLVVVSISCKTSQQVNEVWYELPKNSIVADKDLPSEYLPYRLNLKLLRERLSLITNDSTEIALRFPNPAGNMIEYRVKRSSIVSERLLEKYPSLAAYRGISTLDTRSKIRFEVPKQGLQLMGTAADGTWFISPLSTDANHHIVYLKSKLERKNTFWEGRIN